MITTEQSPLIARYRGLKTPRVPVWFMRQAGRFLPEYREIRNKYSMLEVIQTPELACKVTLQPLNRFELDGAIIFADILTPLIGMGIKLDFVKGEGPKIYNPIKSAEDVLALKIPKPEDNVGYTLEAISKVAAKLNPIKIPLLGFSGAPFTLSSYLLEEDDSSTAKNVKHFALKNESAWHELQSKLAKLVSEYLVAQVDAGASAVQLFDSWVGALTPSQFERLVMPHLRVIVSQFRSKTNAPIVYFGTSTAGLLPQIASLGFDVVSVDWRITLEDAGARTNNIPIQGNLDPAVLAGPINFLEEEVLRILNEGSRLKSHIFNLGHGIIPSTPPENVARVVQMVREYSHHDL